MPQTTMMKGTGTNRTSYAMIVICRKGKISRTPSGWTKELEKNIPANSISAGYVSGPRENRTKVPQLDNTVSGNRSLINNIIS